MTPVFIDFETFWSKDHSLSKMNPITYVMHPETEIISVSIKKRGGKNVVAFGEENIRRLVAGVDWSKVFLIGHNNSEFDAMIAAWRLGIRPKMWGCTLAMARPHYAKHPGLSLAALCEHLGIGEKLSLEATNTKGRHLKDFTSEEVEAMRTYNARDTDLAESLFEHLMPLTSVEELWHIDTTIRMLVEPQFELDTKLLQKTLKEERARKRTMLLDVATMVGAYKPGMDDAETEEAAAKVLASGPKFAQLLRELNVDVPMKPSPTNPEKQTYALAKTDQSFIDLQDHPDPIVAAAACARLGVKSTLLETRIQKFLEAGEAAGGMLPITTRYYGADTTGRRSGWAYNPLNLPRINPKVPNPKDTLRMSMRAPKGKKVVVADLSGIELRVNHFLWKVFYSTALYQADPEADLYRASYAIKMRCAPDEITMEQRHASKTENLGLGFGMGKDKYYVEARKAGLSRTQEQAAEDVEDWRERHVEIVDGWRACHAALPLMLEEGEHAPIDPWGLCTPVLGGIKTPKGMIRYPDLRREQDEKTGKWEWVYGRGRHKARIYAGKIDENIVQHLARQCIADMALAFARTPLGKRYRPALEVYDELVYVTDERDALEALENLQTIMRAGVSWWPELVTWSEGDIADTYGGAK